MTTIDISGLSTSLTDTKCVFEGAHNKDEGYQCCKKFLSKSCDVANIGTGVKHYEQQQHYANPDTNPESEREIVPVLIFTHLKQNLLEHIDWPGRTQQVKRLSAKQREGDTRD